jgi:hypothetical protein
LYMGDNISKNQNCSHTNGIGHLWYFISKELNMLGGENLVFGGILAFSVSRNLYNLKFKLERRHLGWLHFLRLIFPIPQHSSASRRLIKSISLEPRDICGSNLLTQGSARRDLAIEVSFDLIRNIWINPIVYWGKHGRTNFVNCSKFLNRHTLFCVWRITVHWTEGTKTSTWHTADDCYTIIYSI